MAASWVVSTPVRAEQDLQVPPTHRLVRHFTEEHGLPSSAVSSLAQDSQGFLWVGTYGGLARYDGREFQTVRPDLFGGGVHHLATSADARVAVVERGRRSLFLVNDRDAYAVERFGTGPQPAEVRWVAFDRQDALWVVTETGRLTRLHRERWSAVVLEPASATPLRVFPQDDGSVVISSWDRHAGSLWRWQNDGELELLASAPGRRFTATTTGYPSLFAVTYPLALYRLAGRHLEPIDLGPLPETSRGTGIVERHGQLWLSEPTGLTMIDSSGEREHLTARDGMTSGGPLLVDGEGSLWFGTATSLVQIPEPATRTWSEAQGLPLSHVTSLALGRDEVWLSTWAGLGKLELRAEGRGAHAKDLERQGLHAWPGSQVCTDGDSRLWLAIHDGSLEAVTLASIDRGAVQAHRQITQPVGCETLADGSVLLATDTEILQASPGGADTEHLAAMPAAALGVIPRWVAGSPSGTLALQFAEQLCLGERDALLGSGAAAWRCEDLPNIGEVRDIEFVAGLGSRQELWIASFTGGALRWLGPGDLRPVSALADLDSRATAGLTPSPQGGLWVYGFGFIRRLVPRPGGWAMAEDLGAWHGVSGTARSLAEDAEGTLWIGTWQGLTRVPARARRLPQEAPRVEVVAVLSDGESVGIPVPEISSDRRFVEVHFAAPSLRDPRRTQFRFRMHSSDPWLRAPDAVFRFPRPQPGEHRIEVAASWDGERWTQPAARLSFVVLPPWYRTHWAFVLMLAGLLACFVLAHRLRVAYLVRLERERTRIAMDLHDELGAGLAGLGILGDLLGEGNTTTHRGERLGRRIAAISRELGDGLQEIVWSLNSTKLTLEQLAIQIADRGGRLFELADCRLELCFPNAWPRLGLAPQRARDLQRIVIEALHNAARHAAAERVEVGFSKVARGRWCAWVEDDGRGFEPRAIAAGAGLGLVSMRQRAEDLDATLEVGAARCGGCRIEVRFDLDGPTRRRTWSLRKLLPAWPLDRRSSDGAPETGGPSA